MTTPLTRDNNIVFIDGSSRMRHPREFKTPPPPTWGEDIEEVTNEGEQFYNPSRNPYQHQFDYLDTGTRRMYQQQKQANIDRIHAMKSKRKRDSYLK